MPTPNRSSSSLLAAAAIFFAVAAAAQTAPSVDQLLDATLEAPSTPYQGRVLVTQWFGKQTRAEEMRVYVSPPDKIRREYMSPDGGVSRVSVSDGTNESVRLVRSGKIIIGNSVGSDEKVLPPDQERAALLANYDVQTSTGENVAGRPTWKLSMKPKFAGKSWQTLWMDRQTKVVLRTKRFIPHRQYANSAQFASFEPNKSTDPSLFEVEHSTFGVIEARHLAPKFMTLEELHKTTGEELRLPDHLPGGFVFESADVFPIGKNQVRHARYTDGLTVISIFETDRPVKLPASGTIPLGKGGLPLPGPLRSSSAGKVTQWRSHGRYYTLVGDVARELLFAIAKGVR